MVDGVDVVLVVGAALSLATRSALVFRTVCNCALKFVLVVVS